VSLKKNLVEQPVHGVGKNQSSAMPLSHLVILKKNQLLKDDPRPVIRGTAAWALGKIGTEKARQVLRSARKKEKDKDVLNEIEHALAD
jgi:hypothetical protein